MGEGTMEALTVEGAMVDGKTTMGETMTEQRTSLFTEAQTLLASVEAATTIRGKEDNRTARIAMMTREAVGTLLPVNPAAAAGTAAVARKEVALRTATMITGIRPDEER